MIVIAEYGPDSFGRIQRRECFRTWFDKAAVRRRIVARKNEQVGFCSLRQFDNVTDLIDAENAAVMNVGQLRDAKVFEAFGKIANKDVRFGDPVVMGFDE